MVLRAVERVDPRALHGRPWGALEFHEQIELLAYSDLRLREENFSEPAPKRRR